MDSLGTTSMSLTGNESRENDWLVVSTPLKNNNGKDYPIYYGKRNMFETTSQMKVYNVCMKKTKRCGFVAGFPAQGSLEYALVVYVSCPGQ